ncbi:MAG: hypothetical protein WA625_03925 [Pseudolabrys sp.]
MPNLVQPITVSIVLTVQMLLLGYATNQVLAVLLLFLAIFLFAIRPGGAEYGLRLVYRRGQKIFGHEIKPDAMGVSSGFCCRSLSSSGCGYRTGSLQQRGEAAADRCPVR